MLPLGSKLVLNYEQLEEKVAELETKSYGATVENENLRGILKRLQEENVAFKQSAFSFSMPLGSGNSPAVANRQTTKPPSPPNGYGEEGLRSINDPPLPRRTGSDESPESLVSLGSNSGSGSDILSQNQLRDADAFNPLAVSSLAGSIPIQNSTQTRSAGWPSRSNSDISPVSSTSENKSDIDALFASFYPNGIDAFMSGTQPQGSTNNGMQSDSKAPFEAPSPFNFANLQPSSSSFSQFGDNNGKSSFNSMAYRDPTPITAETFEPTQPQRSPDPWSSFTDTNVNDFLASLTGANNDNVELVNADDDFFNTQLQQILQQNGSGNSPSTTLALPQNGPSFSPTNYLNISPSPLNSTSNNAQWPVSQPTASDTNSTQSSPESTCPYQNGDTLGHGISTLGDAKAPEEHVYIVDTNGKVIQPSEMWVKLGLQHEVSNPFSRLVSGSDQHRSNMSTTL